MQVTFPYLLRTIVTHHAGVVLSRIFIIVFTIIVATKTKFSKETWLTVRPASRNNWAELIAVRV